MHQHPLLHTLLTALFTCAFAAVALFAGYDPHYVTPQSVYEMWNAGMNENKSEEYTVEVPALEPGKTEIHIEAERWSYPAGVYVSQKRAGYSGSGYLKPLPEKTERAVAYKMNLKYSQHYAVSFCVGADKPVKLAWRLNGEVQQEFTVEGGEKFVLVTFYGVYMEKGDAVISLDTLDGIAELDYIEVTDDSSLSDAKFDLDRSPCNPDASEQTQRLYTFLREQWGTHMLTGQYVSDSRDRELDLIYNTTGQLPAVRFSALGTENDQDVIESATNWSYYMHGIVGLMWNWNAPGTESVYAKDGSFDLAKALLMQDTDAAAMLSAEEIESAEDAGTLSPDLAALLRDIDDTANSLKKLANMDIPVLWRPLHEASGGWFWWGASGADAYAQLWSLLYHRLTDYHKLNNLIWIWNGQSAGYIIPSDQFDIASVDVYLNPETEFGSRYEQFLALQRITGGKKLLALSECSALPSPARMELDSALWSFYGTWYGGYLMDTDGSFNTEYYSSSDLCNLYNCELALTLKDFLAIYQ